MSGDGNLDLDLFGEPRRLPQDGRGRPPHEPTRETRNRVLLGLVRGLTIKKIARSIGVSAPTLYQHYSDELEQREHALLKMEMRQLELLVAEAEKGNVAANKELDKRLEKLRLRDAHDVRAPVPKKTAKEKPLGKKDQAKVDASGVGGKFAPRQPPAMLIN